MQSRPTTRRRVRGFTLVELLTSVSVFAIGATGIIALQKATIAGNAFGAEITTANQIAQSWLDVLSMDAEQWSTQELLGSGDTDWLKTAAPADEEALGQWQAPAEVAEWKMGPAFDGLGQPLLGGGADTRFCVQVRVRWLCKPGGVNCGGDENLGNGLLRTEVRVFWPRSRPKNIVPADFCTNAEGEDVAPLREDYHIIGLTSAVKQAATR